MEGLATVVAKQKFCEAIESLRRTDGRAAWEGMNEALSGGLADAACGLMLLKTFAAHKNQYDEIVRELNANVIRLAEMPTTLDVSSYGYYALARCYAILGIKRETSLSNFFRTTFRSNFFRTTLRMTFKSELMNRASSLYLQCIARDTAFAEAVFELGLVYDLGLNLRDNAIEAYEIVTRLNPDHTLARGNLTNLYNETGQFEEAQEEAEHLVRLSPNAVSYTTLSGIYARQKMTREAWLAARAALQLPEQRGVMEIFSGRKYLVSPETVGPVPVNRAPQPMFQPRVTQEAHLAL